MAEQLFQRLAVPSSNLGYSLKWEMFPRGILHPYLGAGGCSGERALFPAQSVSCGLSTKSLHLFASLVLLDSPAGLRGCLW